MSLQPDQLFTATNIVSVGVATLIVNVVTNAFYTLLKFPPKWTAFVTALVVAYLVVGLQVEPRWYEWVLAFFNACLLFCSALGINELGVAATVKPGKGIVTPNPLLNSWLRP